MLARRRSPAFAAAAVVTVTCFATTFSAGCASSTVIASHPPGAAVFLDGQPVGQTPLRMTDTKIVGSTTSVRLEMYGYDPLHTTITRNEELDVMALFASPFLLFVPLLWIMQYRPYHEYQLRPLGYSGYPPAIGPPPSGYPTPVYPAVPADPSAPIDPSAPAPSAPPAEPLAPPDPSR